MADPPSALVAFCRDEWPCLVGALTLVTGDVELAHELAQECLVRVSRDWHKVSRMDAPGAWAHRVAMNLANTHFRRQAAERRASARLQQRSSTSAHDADVDTADIVAVRDALAALPLRQRLVLVARYYLDWSVRDTARALACPEGTVKTLTRQALQSLRASGLIENTDVVEEPTDAH